MTIELDLQIACLAQHLPTFAQFQDWVGAALSAKTTPSELTIRIVTSAESAELNLRYRNKSGPTNVLSFPADIDPQFNCDLLGDIIICADVVATEAAAMHKLATAHWAHIVVHGVLHLLGYNHIVNQEAIIMEKLETEILVALGFPPPYGAPINHA